MGFGRVGNVVLGLSSDEGPVFLVGGRYFERISVWSDRVFVVETLVRFFKFSDLFEVLEEIPLGSVR